MSATPRLGYGTWPLGGYAYGPVGEEEAYAALRRAVELGINIYDVADIYGEGRVEHLLSQTVPASAEIIGKVGYLTESGRGQDFTEGHIMSAVEGSLSRLGRSAFGSLLLHSPPAHLLAERTVRDLFERIRAMGITDKVGVSLRSVEDARYVLDWELIEDIEVILNVLDQRAIDVGLVEWCTNANVRLLARVPLCSGFLAGHYAVGSVFPPGDTRSRWPQQQIDRWIAGSELVRQHCSDGCLLRASLQFLTATECVVPIPGMKRPTQVEEVLAAVGAPSPGDLGEEWSRLRGLWRSDLNSLPPS